MNTPLLKALTVIIEIARPDKIILFGSNANGTAKEGSDLDLLVIKKNVKECRALTQKIYLNFENIGAPVDVIVTDWDTFESEKNNPYKIYSDADKFGEIVYEK